MYKLNLPEINPPLKKENGKVLIFDGIRKKYIVLTPEEWGEAAFYSLFDNGIEISQVLFLESREP